MIFTTKHGTIATSQINLVMNRYKLTATWTYTPTVTNLKQQSMVELDKDQTRAVAAQLHNFIHSRVIIVSRHGSEQSAINLLPSTDGRLLSLDMDVNGVVQEPFKYLITKNEAKQVLDYMNANMEQFVFNNDN